ncbi:MAG: gamma-glutamyl-gamma-aminobutyrate hydrolase family protein [Chloroflexota bacterium]|nr:gamma-glutamyl-gamma-aminobutyrate hydrolase family protein [Chloroflexota bacterium]
MVRPRIAVTLSNSDRAANPAVAVEKNGRYLSAIERHGATAVPLDERVPERTRDEALAAMDGLLITGGADLDPALYGEAPDGANPADPGRDALDAVAFEAANERGVPVLGVCRGLQAINVFSGGRLVQHLAHHESPPYPARSAEATRHLLELAPASRLATILGGASQLEVNSFHHQAVAQDGLAAGLRASGLAPHEGGELIEALESEDPDRWLVAVQCHPERVESTPAVMDALWTAFVAAAAEKMGSAARPA